ncbi:MAG: GGDEF domain-containing protein [Bacilli bacterium]
MSNIDVVTGIHNEEYLKKNYQKYIDTNPNSNFIMIDFEKFKLINDTFGHNIGDNYLKVFAKIINDSFKDSIVVRLHGDEFAILTKYDEDYIDKIFKLCNKKIELAVLEGIIPKTFGYNAGSTKAEHSIINTKEKADIMMYYAKKQGKYFQRYDEVIFQEKMKQNEFLHQIDITIKQDEFTYSIRQLHSKDKTPKSIFQIYTKDKNGNSIYNSTNYSLLRKTSKIHQFDIYNIQNILENITFYNNQIIITIDYKSLVFTDKIIDYLNILKDISQIPFQDIIISIDLSSIEISHYNKAIEKINELKKLGFKICLDKFDNTIGDIMWESTFTDFISFSNSYWKQALNISKSCKSIESKSKIFDSCGIIPIFNFIENENELVFLTNITPDNTLYSGNYFSGEKKLILKK